jgi:hypothetical protein
VIVGEETLPLPPHGSIRPFQENKSPKNGEFSERKASGLGGFNFWNYLSQSFTAHRGVNIHDIIKSSEVSER